MSRHPAVPDGGQPDPAAPSAQPSASVDPSATLPGTAAETVTGLLGAGIQALKVVHDDMRARRSRVFAALLGLESVPPEAGSMQTEVAAGTGSRNFDSVFDQRVAESLKRLGYPPPEFFTELLELLKTQANVQVPNEPQVGPNTSAASVTSNPQVHSSHAARGSTDPEA